MWGWWSGEVEKCIRSMAVLCDHGISIKLGIFIRPAMLNGTECWAIKKQYIHKFNVAKMRILRWISGNVRKIGFTLRSFS